MLEQSGIPLSQLNFPHILFQLIIKILSDPGHNDNNHLFPQIRCYNSHFSA